MTAGNLGTDSVIENVGDEHDAVFNFKIPRRPTGATGHFVFRCANGICDTYSVHRTGGGASALKLYNNTCSSSEMMVLGRRPFNGM